MNTIFLRPVLHGLLWLLFLFSAASGATPTISWSPSSVTQKVATGQTKTVPVTFTASENISNAVVSVVPALAPFVATNPSSFASISKGQTRTLTLTISAAATSPIGTFDGTIQLKSGGKSNTTFAKPLPVTVTVTPEKRPTLVTKEVSVQLSVLQNLHNVPLETLTVSTLLSEHTLAAGETTALMTFADADKGQILFVANPDGTPFLIAYISAAEIRNGTADVTVDSVARGLIMLNPLMLGFRETDRLAILAYAKTDPMYLSLISEITNALIDEPRNLLEHAVFPKVYEYALTLVIHAVENAAPAAMRYAAAAVLAPTPVTGSDTTPYLGDVPGVNIVAVNPTMLFYGVDVTGYNPQVKNLRQSRRLENVNRSKRVKLCTT